MSYYYEDTEYADYGNHGDEYDEYDAYSDYTEPDHYEHEDVPGEFKHGHREPEYETQELGELELHDNGTGGNWGVEEERGVEAYELGELDDGRDEEMAHELEALEYTADEEVYVPKWPEYETHEHGELAHQENPKNSYET